MNFIFLNKIRSLLHLISQKTKFRNLLTIATFLLAIIFFGLYFFFYGECKLEYKILKPEYIMSSVYKVYGKEKLGFWVAKVVLTNKGKAAAFDVKISYKVEGFTDWSEPRIYPIINPGSTIVDLYYPIFNSEITKLKISTPSNLKIKITYARKPEGKTKEINETKSINILGSRDFIFSGIPPEESTGTFYDNFSNYPLLAAWVTPADPPLMSFADMGNKLAGGVGASLSDEEALKSLAGIWTVSVNNDIQYKTEPAAFWTGKFSQYVKFPRDTIKDKAGTCIDTALMFVSAAAAQGLRGYVVLMPGHAFPMIQLPQSGQIIPVESTVLNDKASFEEAVERGIETYKNAMAGPNITVDIQTFQSLGVMPPELEELPTDVLSKWGISMGGRSTGGGGFPAGGGQSQTIPTQTKNSYSNPYPTWKVTYPSNWLVVSSGSEVDIYPPSREAEFIVTWVYGATASGVRYTLEQLLLFPLGARINMENQANVAGVPAVKVSYTANMHGKQYVLYAFYLESQNHGFAVLYDFPVGASSLQNSCESIFNSFTF